MCIIFFIASDEHSPNSGYKLILASNRDEMYARPTKAAAPWRNEEYVIAGQDMENGREGGTWLGVSAKDDIVKLGALLNLPGERKLIDNAAGRGPIVANYLRGPINNFDYSDSLLRSKNDYNAFNFVSIEFSKIHQSCQILHTSNAPRGIQEFPINQVHGFSNSGWQMPLKKVAHGKEMFSKCVAESSTKKQLVDNLMILLSEDTKFEDDEELKRRVGSNKIWPQFSSIYVHIPEINYGSRTKTVILIDHKNQLDFYEDSIQPDNTWTQTHIERQLI